MLRLCFSVKTRLPWVDLLWWPTRLLPRSAATWLILASLVLFPSGHTTAKSLRTRSLLGLMQSFGKNVHRRRAGLHACWTDDGLQTCIPECVLTLSPLFTSVRMSLCCSCLVMLELHLCCSDHIMINRDGAWRRSASLQREEWHFLTWIFCSHNKCELVNKI